MQHSEVPEVATNSEEPSDDHISCCRPISLIQSHDSWLWLNIYKTWVNMGQLSSKWNPQTKCGTRLTQRTSLVPPSLPSLGHCVVAVSWSEAFPGTLCRLPLCSLLVSFYIPLPQQKRHHMQCTGMTYCDCASDILVLNTAISLSWIKTLWIQKNLVYFVFAKHKMSEFVWEGDMNYRCCMSRPMSHGKRDTISSTSSTNSGEWLTESQPKCLRLCVTMSLTRSTAI